MDFRKSQAAWVRCFRLLIYLCDIEQQMDSKPPLSGLKVLDLSHLLPGPYLTLMLSDLGASVLKIEKGPYGDLNRRIPPFLHGVSSYFMMLNRNKKSLTLDLKSEKGKKKFLNLVKKTDILVENFRPGVMKRLGLEYNTLKKINPKLIYCAITGYGQTSRWKDFAGHDLNYLALSGILQPTAYPKKRPAMLPTQLADIVGGSLFPMVSLLASLEYRRKTGRGLLIDSSMTAGATALLMMVFGKFFLTGEELFQENDRMTGKYPNYTLYETKDHRYMAVAAIEPKFWKEFCMVIGKPEFLTWVPLADEPGFPTRSLARCSDQELKKMKEKIGKIFKTKSLKGWTQVFHQKPDCCVTPVQNFKEAVFFLRWLGGKDFFYLKNQEGKRFPQWLFPWGNKMLSRTKHTLPPIFSI